MEASKPKLLVIDTDCGVDDSLAIMLALSRHHKDWAIRAITCCRGVTNVDQVSSNVLKILNVVGIKDIPVYKGCNKPILDNTHFETSFHGEDGLGNVSSSLPLAPGQKVQDEYASLALIQHVTQRPGEVTVLALGPLTNLAIAHRLEPQFSVYLKHLVVMGGNIQGLGNSTPLAEFNVLVDPEAAHIVLTEFQCPISVYPWEPCLEQPLPWPFFEKWISKDTKVAELLGKITDLSQKVDRDTDQRKGYLIPDLMAAACCIDPEKVIASTQKAHGLAVELSGNYARGLMVLDRRSQPRKEDPTSKTTDTTLITQINMDGLLEVLQPVTDDTWLLNE